MCGSTEQHICIRVCFKIGKTATEKYQLLHQVYCEAAMGRTQVFDWFRRSKEGRTSVESDPRPEQPSKSRKEETIAKLRKIVSNNSRLTLGEIEDDCGISVGSCDASLTDDLHMKRVCEKFVPLLLTDDQRGARQKIGGDLFEHSSADVQILKNIVQVTNPGSTGTTLRQYSNRHSGRVHRLHDQKWGARCEENQRSCYWRFSIPRVSYNTRTLPKGKQLTRNSNWSSCDV